MGSLNDYGRYKVAEAPRRGSVKRRLLIQTVAAALFFLAVGAFIQADNLLGEGARYVVGQGIDAQNTWVALSGDVVAADSDAAGPDSAAHAGGDAAAEPSFTAPASGVVVTDLAVSVGGFATDKGILIQGTPGQSVKAAADGQVASLGQSDSGYVIALTHSGGFSSVYQGLSSASVAVGDTVAIGGVLGETASGELTFSLLLNDEEVNPLDYLFK